MINVFICTYNPNKAFLKRTVNAILAQTLDKNLWDLTIIDNNSASPVNDIDFIKEMNIRVLPEKKPGLTAARNCAINAATADTLVFVDDDNILNNDYLYWVKEAFTNPKLGLLSGSISPEYIQQPEPWFFPHEEMLAVRKFEGDEVMLNKSTVCNSLFPIGAGMSVKRAVIAGYYAEGNLVEGRKGNELSSHEDMDLGLFAMHQGYEIGIFPKLKMTHIIPPDRLTIKYLTKLSVAALKSAASVNKKWLPVLHHNVFDAFDASYSKIIYQILVNKPLGYFNKSRSMYAAFFLTLLKLKKSGEAVSK